MSNALTLTKLDSGVMLVTIDLPGSKMNLLSESVLNSFCKVWLSFGYWDNGPGAMSGTLLDI